MPCGRGCFIQPACLQYHGQGSWRGGEKEENVCGSWAEEELVMLVTLSHWMVLSGFVSYKRTLLSFGTG